MVYNSGMEINSRYAKFVDSMREYFIEYEVVFVCFRGDTLESSDMLLCVKDSYRFRNEGLGKTARLAYKNGLKGAVSVQEIHLGDDFMFAAKMFYGNENTLTIYSNVNGNMVFQSRLLGLTQSFQFYSDMV